MAVVVSGTYSGGLGVELTHGPSGAKIRTAAPVDNQGDGSSFSPTDMVAAGLGACMLTIIAIVGERDGLKLDGLAFRGEKHMTGPPRRIEKVALVLEMPAGLTSSQRKKLEKAAFTCPVKNSLSGEVETPVEFRYPD
jgi:uncharacterized OsmC-like protein